MRRANAGAMTMKLLWVVVTMSEYVPTIEEVREYVMVGDPKPWEAPSPEVDERERRRGEAFDRWLAAHDREVAAKTKAAIIQRLRDTAQTGRTDSTQHAVADWLELEALVSDPSRAEIMVAFRKMDALAAMGEDTPEYRAAFAEFERAVRNTAPSTPKLCWECDGHGAQITDSGGTDRGRITCHVCGSTPPSTPEQSEGEKP